MPPPATEATQTKTPAQTRAARHDKPCGQSAGAVLLLTLLLSFLDPLGLGGATSSGRQLDPAAWGSDHVGRPLPEYATGDECLFCHRLDVGPGWASNRHGRTVREASGLPDAVRALAVAADIKYVLGNGPRTRFLKPSAEYGKLDLLVLDHKPRWDNKTFADSCAGCHATAVDAETRAFAAVSLDCYVCHGDVNPQHATDGTLVYLARQRKDPARVVISICAQCHVRTGKSRSTGLPYPNQFVAGDNLFRDFQVDLSDEALARQGPADRHILENVRAVVLAGQEDVTCLSCHDLHQQSSKKHHRLAETQLCYNCHHAEGPKKHVKTYEVHSTTCGY